MLKKLVKEEWWTDTSVITDENGWADIEAFKGDYCLSCEDRSVNVELSDDKEAVICI